MERQKGPLRGSTLIGTGTPVINTLDYFVKEFILSVKCFMTDDPGATSFKLLSFRTVVSWSACHSQSLTPMANTWEQYYVPTFREKY